MKIFIMGPTGVGKTKLSVELAKIYDAYIINCDAVQVYKGLDIGSAKVTEEEKCGIKHFLFDIKNPDEEYSVKDYQTDLRNLFDKYSKKNLIIVGGTGLYATAGAYDYRFNDEEKKDYSNYSLEELYKLAKEKDINCNIDKNNRIRLERFLQKDLTSLVEPTLLYNDAIFIGLTTSRENLYKIINKRVDKMIDNGLVQEVKNLYTNYPKSKILKRAIGYKEIIDYLDNKITLEEAVDEIKKNSRHYAKRQYTWFNNKMDIKWFEVNFNYFNETIDNVKDYLNSCK
ncbi:MAG: tRNA (adenosine(37)-N6)-dimethylallyltransferase MiaA [Firmicutes bacterium]|nr:tRNA (adenosine(37)-N6)-dimethylallyltransferase MiaA [Bacillota bacterium]